MDDTTSYIARFQILSMNLTANANPGLPFLLTPTLTSTTLLSSPTPLVYGSGAGVGLGNGAPALNTINDHEFLIDERDGKGLGDNSKAVIKQIYKIDLTGAQDVSNLEASAADQAALLAAKVNKSLFLDLVAELKAIGISNKEIPSKIEGMAFGQDLLYNGVLQHALYLANDNDFLSTITDSNHPNGFANTNNFYVFGIDAATLPSLQAQQFIPEPPTYALMLGSLGLMGIAMQRKRNQK